ncbi:MAG: alpha/beta hydrolase [Magnetococcales bacterium]|nr:alpha/beta hydrolase [Magnetococcales bacterium]
MEQQTVVLIHGLWMPGWEMLLLRHRLRRMGYRTLLFNYATIRKSVTEHADDLFIFLQQQTTAPVYLIGHSLGGVVAIALLQRYPQALIDRVVVLGPPLRGSRMARTVAAWGRGFRQLFGRSFEGALNGEAVGSVPTGRCVGVIAGTLSWGISWLIRALPRPNDGLVAADETHIIGTCDHILYNVSHLGLLLSSHVARQIHYFFASGRFGARERRCYEQ